MQFPPAHGPPGKKCLFFGLKCPNQDLKSSKLATPVQTACYSGSNRQTLVQKACYSGSKGKTPVRQACYFGSKAQTPE